MRLSFAGREQGSYVSMAAKSRKREREGEKGNGTRERDRIVFILEHERTHS
jgi:hypothetical protein